MTLAFTLPGIIKCNNFNNTVISNDSVTLIQTKANFPPKRVYRYTHARLLPEKETG